MSIDRPVVYGRTLRELALLGSTLALGAVELRSNLSLTPLPFAVLAVMLALRWFPARVVFLSTCVSAAALRVGYVIGPEQTLSEAVLPFAGIALLAVLACGRDLVRRFDDEGRGPFPNYWRTLSTPDRRRIAWMAHALSACGAALYYVHFKIAALPDTPAYLVIGIVACSVAGVLLVWGRALAAPVTLTVGVYVACSIAPRIPAALRSTGEATLPLAPLDAMFAPGYVLVAFACACAAVAIALPWTLRFVSAAAGRRCPGVAG